MKTIFVTFIVIFFIFTSAAFTQQKAIKNSGYTRMEERAVEDFNKIKTTRSIKVFLTQGETISVKVQADTNLLPYIKTTVIDHLLQLTIPDKVKTKPNQEINVYITLPIIKELHASTSAEIKSMTIWKVDELDLSASTSGEIEIEVNANQLNTKASTSGEITLKGTANSLYTRATTSGEIKATELEAQQVSAQASTSGEIKIYVTKKLEYNVSTGGEIHYKGSPLLNGRANGNGKILRIE